MLAPSNATIAEATPQLITQVSSHRHKTCYKFEYTHRTERSGRTPPDFDKILSYAGVDVHGKKYDDLRNACIVYNAKHSKDSVKFYQGKSSFENQGVAAGILTLKENGYSEDKLR